MPRMLSSHGQEKLHTQHHFWQIFILTVLKSLQWSKSLTLHETQHCFSLLFLLPPPPPPPAAAQSCPKPGNATALPSPGQSLCPNSTLSAPWALSWPAAWPSLWLSGSQCSQAVVFLSVKAAIPPHAALKQSSSPRAQPTLVCTHPREYLSFCSNIALMIHCNHRCFSKDLSQSQVLFSQQVCSWLSLLKSRFERPY